MLNSNMYSVYKAADPNSFQNDRGTYTKINLNGIPYPYIYDDIFKHILSLHYSDIA